MKWTITCDDQNALVNVMVEGAIIAQPTAEMAREGIRVARKKNCGKFLIDYTRTDVGDATIDIHQFMAGWRNLA